MANRINIPSWKAWQAQPLLLTKRDWLPTIKYLFTSTPAPPASKRFQVTLKAHSSHATQRREMRKPLFCLSLEELAASSPSPVLLWGCSHSQLRTGMRMELPPKAALHTSFRQSHLQTLPSSKQEHTDKGSDPREMPLPMTLINETGGWAAWVPPQPAWWSFRLLLRRLKATVAAETSTNLHQTQTGHNQLLSSFLEPR